MNGRRPAMQPTRPDRCACGARLEFDSDGMGQLVQLPHRCRNTPLHPEGVMRRRSGKQTQPDRVRLIAELVERQGVTATAKQLACSKSAIHGIIRRYNLGVCHPVTHVEDHERRHQIGRWRPVASGLDAVEEVARDVFPDAAISRDAAGRVLIDLSAREGAA
jgi:hypothetical protein